MGFDAWLAHTLNAWAAETPGLGVAAVIAASWLIWVLVLWYAVAFVWHKRSGVREFTALALGVALVYATNAIIGAWWFRFRPFFDDVTVPLIYVVPLVKSFPSDHAAVAFFVAYLLVAHQRRWWYAYLAAALVALGRVFVGVHYPLDILAGMVIGLAYGYLTTAAEALLRHNKT